jgi:lysozyme family protein
MKADFTGALAFVLQAEGGFSDDPDDPGGATNLGIEQTEYRTFFNDQSLDVRNITEAQASEIYQTSYWSRIHGDYLPPPLAYAMFDTAVNIGVVGAINCLQGVLGVPLTETWSDDPSDALWAYIEKHPALELATGVLTRRKVYYERIAQENPTLQKFLQGWMNRANALQSLIDGLPA